MLIKSRGVAVQCTGRDSTCCYRPCISWQQAVAVAVCKWQIIDNVQLSLNQHVSVDCTYTIDIMLCLEMTSSHGGMICLATDVTIPTLWICKSMDATRPTCVRFYTLMGRCVLISPHTQIITLVLVVCSKAYRSQTGQQ